MTLTADMQFQVGGVEFGSARPVDLAPDGFTPEQAGWRTQDAEHPTGSGGVPGRDVQGVSTWAFSLLVHETDRAAAMSAASELRSVWPSAALTGTPRALAELRYRLAGRTRLVYGRPRRWTPLVNDRSKQGVLPIEASFDVFDPLHYDDTERSVSSDMTGSTNPLGISSPVRSPFAATFGEWQAPSRTAVVGGDRATWPIIEFQGGVNPWVELAGWRCRVLASLNWDEVVTVDTRPWVRSSTLNGSYMPLDRGSRLAEMSLPPGNWPVNYGNDSSAGAPSVTVRWRDAYSSL